jgi:poly-gamma-glutamate capsule biosynthesis protein CapA/YwtB (metallophosphatase superfamily)
MSLSFSLPVPNAIIPLILMFLGGCVPQSSLNPVTTQGPNPLSTDISIANPAPTDHNETPTPYPLTPIPSTSSPSPSPSPIPPTSPGPKLTTLLFTGVIVPARCVQAAVDERDDPDYPYAEVREIITQADLAVGTLNATISDYPARTGCVSTYVLVGGSENADALARAGFDVMSVATNHIKNCGESNCGDRAFLDTLDNLRRVDILPVGAGDNLARAMQPVVATLNGIRFGIVSLGQIEPLAFAGENSPGIAVLDEESLRAAIKVAREVSDVVIAMPHWGPEDVPTPNWIQRDLARVAVEAGADLVVGNHTHVVQAVEDLDGVMVFYGLGNFVFDQNWARDHQQGVILQVSFDGDRYAGYEFIPTHVDGDGRVHIAGADEAAEILDRIEEVSPNLP